MSHLVTPAPGSAPLAWPQRLRQMAHWIGQRPWLALPILAIPALWPFVDLGLGGSADGTRRSPPGIRAMASDPRYRHRPCSMSR